ncbi:MAG: SDR family NAD(P)-dependent oxidoreductase [Bacteroidota bacterium]
MSKWSIQDVSHQRGKVAVVTGANSGIGYHTVLGLSKKGFEVVLACRDLEKACIAKWKVKKENHHAELTSMMIDTSNLSAVSSFVAQFGEQYNSLDLLVNNAGIMMPPNKVSEDGFENQLATNYLGHFALTGLLLPHLLNSPGFRVISLSSLSYKWAGITFEDLHFEEKYSPSKAYGQSKRACLVFAYELQRRLSVQGYNAFSVAVHPGLSNTNLDKYFPKFI